MGWSERTGMAGTLSHILTHTITHTHVNKSVYIYIPFVLRTELATKLLLAGVTSSTTSISCKLTANFRRSEGRETQTIMSFSKYNLRHFVYRGKKRKQHENTMRSGRTSITLTTSPVLASRSRRKTSSIRRR